MDNSDKTRAIVLKAIRYGDNNLIVKLLTENTGLQSFMVKGVFNKNAKIRAALFQPLTLLDIVQTKSRGDLGYLKEAGIEYSFKDIPANINKNAIILFICELLLKSIQETETDITLFDFIHNALTHLDEMDGNIADFPLKFAMELSRHLGFSPNINNYKPLFIFDLEDGCFHHDAGSTACFIDSHLSGLYYRLCNTNIFNDLSLNITNHERRQLLEAVIKYYKLHVSGFNDMNSVEILKTVLQSDNVKH